MVVECAQTRRGQPDDTPLAPPCESFFFGSVWATGTLVRDGPVGDSGDWSLPVRICKSVDNGAGGERQAGVVRMQLQAGALFCPLPRVVGVNGNWLRSVR